VKSNLAEIEIVGEPTVSRYDSEWITNNMRSTEPSWMASYLSGSPMGERPLWELLVDGRGFVLGTRVRERAYDTVKRKWPQSLGLLELSRVAVELNSDLGLIGYASPRSSCWYRCPGRWAYRAGRPSSRRDCLAGIRPSEVSPLCPSGSGVNVMRWLVALGAQAPHVAVKLRQRHIERDEFRPHRLRRRVLGHHACEGMQKE
jgi:hypothetical protein